MRVAEQETTQEKRRVWLRLKKKKKKSCTVIAVTPLVTQTVTIRYRFLFLFFQKNASGKTVTDPHTTFFIFSKNASGKTLELQTRPLSDETIPLDTRFLIEKSSLTHAKFFFNSKFFFFFLIRTLGLFMGKNFRHVLRTL